MRRQRILSSSLRSSLFPDSLAPTIAKRCLPWSVPLPEPFWEPLRDLIKAAPEQSPAPAAWQNAVIKIVVGGWLSCSRLHSSELRDCLFGCHSCDDQMSHYVRCPVLWSLAYHPAEPTVCLAERLGLNGSPSPEVVERLVRAYHIYNIARTSSSPGSPEARESHHYQIRRAAEALIEHSRAPF